MVISMETADLEQKAKKVTVTDAEYYYLHTAESSHALEINKSI